MSDKEAEKVIPAVDHKNTSQKNDAKPEPGTPLLAKAPSAPIDKDSPTKGEADYEKEKERALRVLPVMLSIFALITSVKACDNNWRSANAAEQSALASRRAADAAERNVTTAREALDATIKRDRLDQRAWVGVVKAIKPPMVTGGEHRMGVRIINSGKTPARKLATRMKTRWVPRGVPFTPDFPRGRERATMLHPRMTIDLAETIKLHPSVIPLIGTGDVVLYFFGTISYWDIFDCQHTETFCLYLGESLSTLRNCLVYNEPVEDICPEQESSKERARP